MTLLAPPVQTTDHAPPSVQLETGRRYGARMKLVGSYSFASKGKVAETLQKQGFANVIVEDDPARLPSSWPLNQREKNDGWFESTFFVTGTWALPPKTYQTQFDPNVIVLGFWDTSPGGVLVPGKGAPTPTGPALPPQPYIPQPQPEPEPEESDVAMRIGVAALVALGLTALAVRSKR